jgi:preprotein translocase subunit SecY
MNLGQINLLEITLLLAFMMVVVGVIVYIEKGQYRVPIQYPKKVVGSQVYGGQSTHLPLKVNVSGVLPPIFASSLMFFPATIGQLFPNDFFAGIASAFAPGTYTYMVTYVVLIVVFTFFYTAISFNPQDVADNLRRQGGYIPGVRPGKQTQEELDRILLRLTAGGALYLSAVCILPEVLANFYNVPFYFGGTGLLIIVGVCMQTVAQIEGFMLTQRYDGLSGPEKKQNKGRRGTFQQNANRTS